jgi:hypothetical protein
VADTVAAKKNALKSEISEVLQLMDTAATREVFNHPEIK